jgi:hypothetical protein
MEEPLGKRQLEDKKQDKTVTLSWILRRWVMRIGYSSGSCPMAGFSIRSIEPLGSAAIVVINAKNRVNEKFINKNNMFDTCYSSR